MERIIRAIACQILITLLPLCLLSPAQASGTYGLAMHGVPKYGPDFDHFDYVNKDAPKGGQVIQSFPGSFDTLNPFNIKGTAAQGLSLYYDKLMARVWDEPFTLYPLIAEKADVPDDRSSITFHLNPKARFHDGSPITADDVLFSFGTLKDHGRPNMRGVYKLVAKAEKLDDRTVKFTLSPDHDRETVMILAIMPVLSKKWWQGRSFDETILTPPLSNGPYKIAKVDVGRQIVYERVKDYWATDLPVNRGQYNFDRVVYDYYRDDTVALEAFKAGYIDLRQEFDVAKWATAYDIPAVKQGDIVRESMPNDRPGQVNALIFNTRRPPFDDVRVREALSQLLNSKWINDNLFYGRYKRVDSYFPNSILAATGTPSPAELALLTPWKDKLPPEVFGPAWTPPDIKDQDDLRNHMRLADQLLKQAGWIVKDGRRVRADNPNHALTFDILVNETKDEKIALNFVDNLRRLGIVPTIRKLDSTGFNDRLHHYDYDMTLWYWQNSLSPGSEQMRYWTCEAAKTPYQWNFSGICNPAIDALAKGIATARTQTDLEADAHALDRALTWGWYIIPLFYSATDDVSYVNRLAHPVKTSVPGYTYESFKTWWSKEAADKTENKH